MNKKVKIIINYSLLFIESIILFLLTMFIVLDLTIMNPEYVIKRMNTSDYYTILEKSIKTEMSYYTGQSGFKEDILDDTFTLDEIKHSTNEYLRNFYNGKKTTIDSSKFETRLNKKIDDYLEEKNFVITNKEEITKFTKEMAKIYIKRIKIIDNLDNMANKIHKLTDITYKLLATLGISLIILLIVNYLLTKKIRFGILLYTSSFLIIVMNIYLKFRIDLAHLFFYNEQLSSILTTNIKGIVSITLSIAAIYFVLATIINILHREKK